MRMFISVLGFWATGALAAPPPSDSCELSCGTQAPAGCWCDNACTGYGDCCTDYVDECVASPPPSCADAKLIDTLPFTHATSTAVEVNTFSFGANDCTSEPAGYGSVARDKVYRYIAGYGATFKAVLTPVGPFDSVLYVSSSCIDVNTNTCLGANELPGAGVDEVVAFDLAAGEQAFITVDGVGASQGAYQLEVYCSGDCPADLPALEWSDPRDEGTILPGDDLVLRFAASAAAFSSSNEAKLVCDGTPVALHAPTVSGDTLIFDPPQDLPEGVLCTLGWWDAETPRSLAFVTTSASADIAWYDIGQTHGELSVFPDDMLMVDVPDVGPVYDVPRPYFRYDVGLGNLYRGVEVKPEHQVNGASPLGYFYVHLGEELQATSLPSMMASRLPGSSVRLFDLETWQRISLRVEKQAGTVNGVTDHLLLITPAVALEPGHSYGLVITTDARSVDGEPLIPSALTAAALAAPRPGETDVIARKREQIDEILAAYAMDPFFAPDPADVAMATRITVRTRENFHDPVSPRLQLRELVQGGVLGIPGGGDVGKAVIGGLGSIGRFGTPTADGVYRLYKTWMAPVFSDRSGYVMNRVDGEIVPLACGNSNDCRGPQPFTLVGVEPQNTADAACAEAVPPAPAGSPWCRPGNVRTCQTTADTCQEGVAVHIFVPPVALGNGPFPVLIYQHGHPTPVAGDEIFATGDEWALRGYVVVAYRDPIARRYPLRAGVNLESWVRLYLRDQIDVLASEAGRHVFLEADELETNAEQLALLRAVRGAAVSNALLDDDVLLYLGQSKGSFAGIGLIPYAPQISQAVLMGGGGRFTSHVSHQAIDVVHERIDELSVMTRARDSYLLLAEMGIHLDHRDVLNEAPFVYFEPYDFDGPDVNVDLLITEGVGDALVPRTSTQAAAVALGASALLPATDLPFEMDREYPNDFLSSNVGGNTSGLLQFTSDMVDPADCNGIDLGHCAAQFGFAREQAVDFLDQWNDAHDPKRIHCNAPICD